MLYMIVEHYKRGDAAPVYKRFREHGRMAPAGVVYVNSWVTADRAHCYQVMESESREALDAWLAHWSDIVDFEVTPVVTSAEAARAFG